MAPSTSDPPSATGGSGEQSRETGLSSSTEVNTTEYDISQVPAATTATPFASPLVHDGFRSASSPTTDVTSPTRTTETATTTPMTFQHTGDEVLPCVESTSSAAAMTKPVASSPAVVEWIPFASSSVHNSVAFASSTVAEVPPIKATTKTPDTSSGSSDCSPSPAIESNLPAAAQATPVSPPLIHHNFSVSSPATEATSTAKTTRATTTTPNASPHHGNHESSSSECDSPAFSQFPVATAATTPEGDTGGRPPFSTFPVQNRNLLPVRIQRSRPPSAREAYKRQRRHLDYTTARGGSEFVWSVGSEPTEETARELLGFYLNNEDLVQRTRCLGLPFRQATATAVAEGVAWLSVGSVRSFACGAHNVLFEVSFVVYDSSPRSTFLPVVVVLLRINQPEDPFYRLESGVATSTFARDVAGVPAPRTYSFDSSGANPLGLEWALVEKMAGRPLDALYSPSFTRMPLREKEAIMDELVLGQLSRHWARLFNHAFAGLGSLYLVTDASGAYYAIGPVVSPFFCLGRRLLCEAVDRGPYTHLRHYVRAQLRLVQWELPPSPPRWLSSGSQDGDAGTREWRRSCEKMQVVADWAEATLVHPDLPLRTFPVHPDLHHDNLLMDAQYQLTGILDWENIACLPLALYAPPSVATADGGLGNCGPARFETLAQLPPPDQLPWAILCACSTSGTTMTASLAGEGEGQEEEEARGDEEGVIPLPESRAQYLARCTARLRSAGVDFSAFPWWAPEYFSAPSSRAVVAANAGAHAGAEGPWAALQQNVHRLGLIHMRGDEDEEKRACCSWLDDAFRFCGGGAGGKKERAVAEQGEGGGRHSRPPVAGAGARENNLKGSRSNQ